jgi:hypothetical protein
VYAAVTRATGANPDDMGEIAVMVGETMAAWLAEIDGFKGLLMLTDAPTGTVQVVALWESKEIADRHRAARTSLRDRVSATVEVEVQETVGWDVPYTYLPA